MVKNYMGAKKGSLLCYRWKFSGITWPLHSNKVLLNILFQDSLHWQVLHSNPVGTTLDFGFYSQFSVSPMKWRPFSCRGPENLVPPNLVEPCSSRLLLIFTMWFSPKLLQAGERWYRQEFLAFSKGLFTTLPWSYFKRYRQDRKEVTPATQYSVFSWLTFAKYMTFSITISFSWCWWIY